MKLVIYTGNCVGNAKNCLYPTRWEITSGAELAEAVKLDHVCAEYADNYRSIDNFRASNVVVMDVDNDHTENAEEWIDADKLDELMPDIALVWFGLTWSLELYQQTNARLWRQGQTASTVVIQHIVAKDTVDERILKALTEKNNTQEALIAAVKAEL